MVLRHQSSEARVPIFHWWQHVGTRFLFFGRVAIGKFNIVETGAGNLEVALLLGVDFYTFRPGHDNALIALSALTLAKDDDLTWLLFDATPALLRVWAPRLSGGL